MTHTLRLYLWRFAPAFKKGKHLLECVTTATSFILIMLHYNNW